MQELRWILLLIGVLFLIVLAVWEMLRARRGVARRELFPHLDREMPREPSWSPGTAAAARHAAHDGAEPHLDSLPDGLVESSHLDGAAEEPIRAQRAGPPLIELPQVSAVHLEVADNADNADNASGAAEEPLAAGTTTQPVESREAVPEDLEAMRQREPTASPRVEWPPDGERQILSIRIMSASEQRLSGRSVRQALSASGFVHGRYHIFHQPAEDGRVLLSCASLNKPGNFDPSAMDFQRYSGLSIFTVLPGPLPAQAALERLLAAGREVSQRLQARLLDERGEPLDSMRIATLRASVAAAAGTAGGPAGRTVAASALGGEPRA
jgi:FtsZ-interacting cell division protein ZipA